MFTFTLRCPARRAWAGRVRWGGQGGVNCMQTSWRGGVGRCATRYASCSKDKVYWLVRANRLKDHSTCVSYEPDASPVYGGTTGARPSSVAPPKLVRLVVFNMILDLVCICYVAWVSSRPVPHTCVLLASQEHGFILNIDTKWRTHPDISTVPREEWQGHPSVAELYCLAISHRRGIRTLRDLRSEHVPMLKEIYR